MPKIIKENKNIVSKKNNENLNLRDICLIYILILN